MGCRVYGVWGFRVYGGVWGAFQGNYQVLGLLCTVSGFLFNGLGAWGSSTGLGSLVKGFGFP